MHLIPGKLRGSEYNEWCIWLGDGSTYAPGTNLFINMLSTARFSEYKVRLEISHQLSAIFESTTYSTEKMASHEVEYEFPDFDELPEVPGQPKGCLWGFFDRDGKKDQLGSQ